MLIKDEFYAHFLHNILCIVKFINTICGIKGF